MVDNRCTTEEAKRYLLEGQTHINGRRIRSDIARRINEYREAWRRNYPEIPYGTCCCGCGRETWVATLSLNERGWVKYSPVHFVRGHQKRCHGTYVVTDRGGHSPCWVWQGNTNAYGYGVSKIDGSLHMAHRDSYERTKGTIPEGLVLHHLCVEEGFGTTLCVNPDHLLPMTQCENRRRNADVKLNIETARLIRREYRDDKATQAELATRYGVTRHHISAITTGAAWHE